VGTAGFLIWVFPLRASVEAKGSGSSVLKIQTVRDGRFLFKWYHNVRKINVHLCLIGRCWVSGVFIYLVIFRPRISSGSRPKRMEQWIGFDCRYIQSISLPGIMGPLWSSIMRFTNYSTAYGLYKQLQSKISSSLVWANILEFDVI
jgi:hypothetical protein